MRTRISVSVEPELLGRVLSVVQAYAVGVTRGPEQLLGAVDAALDAAVVVSLDVAGPASGLALLSALRGCHPLLPLLVPVREPTPALVQELSRLDAEWLPHPISPALLHRFAQRALAFGALPDEAVARWVSHLATSRGLVPREVLLLTMALRHAPRSSMRRALGIRENTLKSHVRGLLRKTGERSLDALAKNVLRTALLEARPGTRDIYRAPWQPAPRRAAPVPMPSAG